MNPNYLAIAARSFREVEFRDLVNLAYHYIGHQLSIYNRERSGIWKPTAVAVEITHKCNRRCPDCYIVDKDPMPDMEPELLERVVSQCESYGGIHSLPLLGGEPLQDGNIQMIATTAQNHPRMLIGICTNGDYLAKNGLDSRLKELHNVYYHVCLAGANEDSHNFFRGGKDSFNNVLQAFKVLRSAKKFYGATVLIRDETFDELTDPKFFDSLVDCGVKLAFIIRLKGGNGMDKGKFRRAREKIRRYSGKSPLFFTFGNINEGISRGGYSKLMIDPQGGVRTTKTITTDVVGNIGREDLARIIDNINKGRS